MLHVHCESCMDSVARLPTSVFVPLVAIVIDSYFRRGRDGSSVKAAFGFDSDDDG